MEFPGGIGGIGEDASGPGHLRMRSRGSNPEISWLR